MMNDINYYKITFDPKSFDLEGLKRFGWDGIPVHIMRNELKTIVRKTNRSDIEKSRILRMRGIDHDDLFDSSAISTIIRAIDLCGVSEKIVMPFNKAVLYVPLKQLIAKRIQKYNIKLETISEEKYYEIQRHWLD
jgi:hypothetical protein